MGKRTCLVATALVCAVFGLAAAPNDKGFLPGKDGWLTLFDGSDLRKWEKAKGADWTVRDGTLVGTKGTLSNYWHWQDFECRIVCRGQGRLRFRYSLAPMPDQPGYFLDLATGALSLAEGKILAKGTAGAEGWHVVTLKAVGKSLSVALDGQEVAQASDDSCPEKGMLVLEPGAKPLEVRLIRARPLGREQFVNIPSPNSACYVCHRNFDGEEISKEHLEEKVSCATCHGPSLAHRSDEDNVTTPDVMFTRGEVEGACLRCHKRHKAEKKRKDGKEPPPPNPVCTDCHGNHKARN